MAFDLSDDFDLVDGVESVVYQRRGLDGTSTPNANVKALKRHTVGTLADYGAGAQTTLNVSKWHLKASDLDAPPRRGDRVVSEEYGTWEVLEDNVETFATRYACNCKEILG